VSTTFQNHYIWWFLQDEDICALVRQSLLRSPMIPSFTLCSQSWLSALRPEQRVFFFAMRGPESYNVAVMVNGTGPG